MKQTALAVTLAVAMLSTIVSNVEAQSCTSTHAGNTTFINCFGPDGAHISGTTTTVGNMSFGNYFGTDAYGRTITGTSTSLRVGGTTYTDIWLYPSPYGR